MIKQKRNYSNQNLFRKAAFHEYFTKFNGQSKEVTL